MSGCNRVRSVVKATTSGCLRPSSRPHWAIGITRDSRRALSLDATTRSLCRRHQHDLNIKKDQIKSRIRLLELGRRRFSTSPAQKHGHIDPPKPGEEYGLVSSNREDKGANSVARLHVTIVDKDGEEHKFEVSKGDNLLDIAQANDIRDGRYVGDQSTVHQRIMY